MKSLVFARLATSMVVILVGLTTSAHAGPPLICHPIEIGQAKSLPWVDWNRKVSGDYDLKNLTRDTLAILHSTTPVLVRMAMAGGKTDPLLARNLASNFNRQTISELLTNPPAGRI